MHLTYNEAESRDQDQTEMFKGIETET